MSKNPVEGVVKIGKRWEFGTLGEASDLPGLHKIYYENAKGNRVSVVRDVKNSDHWRPGVDVLPETDEAPAPKKAKAPAKPKATGDEIVQYATGAAPKGGNTFHKDDPFHVCTGACGLKLVNLKFPTISGTDLRVSECRVDRDTRRAAEKAAKAA